MNKYLINNVATYVVPTVDDALELRAKLSKGPGELVSFTYTTKQIKEKGEVVQEYQQVKAKLAFQSEKEPEDSTLDISYGYGEDSE